MSHAELDRVSIIQSIIGRRLAQTAQQLKLSIRKVKRNPALTTRLVVLSGWSLSGGDVVLAMPLAMQYAGGH